MEIDKEAIHSLIADVCELREYFGEHPQITKIERKLGRLLPPIRGALNITLEFADIQK